MVCPVRSPGALGVNDPADPSRLGCQGDTPGPVGHNDQGSPPRLVCLTPEDEALVVSTSKDYGPPPPPVLPATPAGGSSDAKDEGWTSMESGSVPVGVGSPGVVSVARIPVPGSQGLFVELSPRGKLPFYIETLPDGTKVKRFFSTSRIFIQDAQGKRVLRLDYGENVKTGQVDYHWNQKGTFKQFGIADHTSVGEFGEGLYKSAKYLKYGGRLLLVVGIASDLYSIVEAKKKVRQVLRVAAGWAGAEAGCALLGGEGAVAGTVVEPGGGTAVVGIAGCLIGSVAGYAGASWATGQAYDYIEEIIYEPLPETPAPPSTASAPPAASNVSR